MGKIRVTAVLDCTGTERREVHRFISMSKCYCALSGAVKAGRDVAVFVGNLSDEEACMMSMREEV